MCASMSHTINSRLMPGGERPDPVALASNAGLSFNGSKIYGQGFTLTPEERNELIAKDKRNAERIFPYIGGKDVNTSPTQMFHRYVIRFADMSLDEAGRWPELLQIVREKVKPERDRLKDNADGRRRKEYWWRFGRETPALCAAIDALPRCLVNSRVSKHLIFAFQPTDRVFANTLWVYPLPAYTHFAILQSRVHEPWARLLSSSMKTDLRYAASDCFENFPFPDSDPRTVLPPLEAIGKKLYEARAAYMVETDQGLTNIYNALKDPECGDLTILRLRRLHEEMDYQVLLAYGWDDLAAKVPPYHQADSAWTDELINRLWDLNTLRASQA